MAHIFARNPFERAPIEPFGRTKVQVEALRQGRSEIPELRRGALGLDV